MSVKVDPQITDLLKKIGEDGKTSAHEFALLTAKINEISAGRDKSAEEIKILRQQVEKAMADAKDNAAEKTRIMEEYKASVPAPVFKDTIKEITEKMQTMLKWVILAVMGSMLLFFGQDLMETLGPLLGSFTP
jgi:hypothetical protein